MAKYHFSENILFHGTAVKPAMAPQSAMAHSLGSTDLKHLSISLLHYEQCNSFMFYPRSSQLRLC